MCVVFHDEDKHEKSVMNEEHDQEYDRFHKRVRAHDFFVKQTDTRADEGIGKRVLSQEGGRIKVLGQP